MSERQQVWVFIEQVDRRIADVSLELVGRARELADELGAEVVGLLCGHGVDAVAGQVIQHGADRVLVADHPELAAYRTLPYARVAICEAVTRRPEIFLVGGTPNGRDLAPRVASALRCGLTADCTDLQLGDYHHRREGRTYQNLLYQIRPAFGGNLVATIVNPGTRPQMATVREGVFRMPQPHAARTGIIESVRPVFEPGDFALEILSHEVRPSKVKLKDAAVIVSGGAGISGADGVAQLRELANLLGGEVGASRAAVDAGLIDREHQVGQTGTTVRPRLYVAAGISGAVQHRAGMDQSSKIIAINTDPEAPIFGIAHYRVVGDAAEVLPMIVKAVRERALDDPAPTLDEGGDPMSDNFFLDNPDLRFRLERLDLLEVVDRLEGGYGEADRWPGAPRSYADALDSYRIVLEVLGEVCAQRIAPRAAEADEDGARFEDGVVTYAAATRDAIDALRQAELFGAMLGRQFGGLNLPESIYQMMVEIVARAESGLMTVFGLQEIASSIEEHADAETKARVLPRFARGEISGAMVLTEADAGSDLGAVATRATLDPTTGCWHLNGVKRFITNGIADVSLVLARSEEGSTDARGLSMFVVERDDTVKIRRIENKLGIHASPTCEIQYRDTPAILVGKRRFGLMRYAMGLMNGARLAVAAQAVGIAEAAYREADRYAHERVQFGRPIRELPAVARMLLSMKVELEATRALLAETGRWVDLWKVYEHALGEAGAEPDPAVRARHRQAAALAETLTPMAKYGATEMGNRVCYQAMQVHGGVGYMREFNIERLFRDVRITNIYEGTSQLQVVAAIGKLLNRSLDPLFAEWQAAEVPECLATEKALLVELTASFDGAIGALKAVPERARVDFYAVDLVETAILVTSAWLLLRDAAVTERKQAVARAYLASITPRVRAAVDVVMASSPVPLEAIPIVVG